MRKHTSNARFVAVVAIMSALSTVLMYLEFWIPIVPNFLKFDFSDLPAMVTSFAISPVAGVLVVFFKNVLHLFATNTGGVGELANFLVGAMLVFPAGFIYKKMKTRKGALLGSLAGMLFSAVVSFPVNYFITYPVYTQFMPMEAIIDSYHAIIPVINSLPKALLIVNMPFTAVKGIICAAITFVIYKPLSPILKGKKKENA